MDRRALIGGGFALAIGTYPAKAEDIESITFDGLYKSFGVLGFEFADRVRALKSKRVKMTGFMAPPLKAESSFFVLTRQPLAICPFCQSDAEWPVDIVVVFLKAATPAISEGRRVSVTGVLEIGSTIDKETGFVSQIRIVEADVQRF
ncbi:MAG: hypothetical protein CFE31_04070 [Rhizobiales bacterium PAR1]|nr:MAG: hypothetical protein CFE31_04070 [Rhizobiales bacterium PAR1]